MKNTYGNNLTVTLFGESHGPAIGCTVDGISPGVKIDIDYINERLGERQAKGDISTPRHEADKVNFLSGVKDGFTTGTPITIVIENTNTKSSSYLDYEFTPRPGHADYAAECKFHGFQDKRGGGHFSGRVTAALVAAGAICRYALESKGIFIGTHIKRLGGVEDSGFHYYLDDIKSLYGDKFPALDRAAGEAMKEKILEAKAEGDSIGGTLETAIIGLPAGVGDPWFDTVEGMLSYILFSVPGVKGVEFGGGFDMCNNMKGSEANDPFVILDGEIMTAKNSQGGVNGGITNGMPIIFRTAIKPTPSIEKLQKTVNTSTMENTVISVKGRHDPAIIHRARAVIDAVSAIAVADMLITKYGTDCLSE